MRNNCINIELADALWTDSVKRLINNIHFLRQMYFLQDAIWKKSLWCHPFISKASFADGD